MRPRANVKMPTMEAVVERGLSLQLRMVGDGSAGEAIGEWDEPLGHTASCGWIVS